MLDSRAVPPQPSVTPRRSGNRRRALLVATGAVAGLLGVVAPAAPLAAQPFTYGATEVHELTGSDSLDDYRTDGVKLCSDELDQIHTDGHITVPDSVTSEETTNEQGERINYRTKTWTRGDPATAAGECKFALVALEHWGDTGFGFGWLVQSSTLTITFSKVMPALNTANYDFIDGYGNVISGNFEVPEGNCADDYPATGSTRFGVRLKSRPDSPVWITFLAGTEAGADIHLWTPSSTTWTISPTDYDLGRTTRLIRVCALPDSDSDNGTRNFHLLLNSNDADFLGTATLVVEEADDD